jgi:UDP-2,3-diacylglucosamine pyrophosphatase LpxH
MRNVLDAPLFPSVSRPKSKSTPHRIRRYRTIFISDTHLGTRGCKADLLADFLAHNDCQTLYLVGDIVDCCGMKRSWYWSDAQTRVLDTILEKVKEGTRVIFVPGNHDEVFRAYCGVTLAGVELALEAVHETADGRRLLVTHGDQYDGIMAIAPWLAHVGDRAYTLALTLNEVFNATRRMLGLPYWSLSAYLKHKVKNAAAFIVEFEKTVAHGARGRGLDGVVCGHIHHAEVKNIGGTLYCNDGDWVESCSALTEDVRGCLKIVHWTGIARDWELATAPVAAPNLEPAAA